MRPHLFRSVVLTGALFAALPSLPAQDLANIHRILAALPWPRKHYQWYYLTHEDVDTRYFRQGVHAFLRADYHHKSADWPDNKPYRLTGRIAIELTKMPTYYIMDLDEIMARTVAEEMPSSEVIAACAWLPDSELRVYACDYERTGFRGGLNWFRCRTQQVGLTGLQIFSGRKIDVPVMFVAGPQDWGIHQSPGVPEWMQNEVCTDVHGRHLLPGADIRLSRKDKMMPFKHYC